MATKAIGYVRVSTEKQADGGLSLDAQRSKLEAYAALYDIELVEVIVDAGQSAATLNRPGLQRALSMVKRGEAEALLVVKLDRLTRSVRDLGNLIERYFGERRGAALLSVGEQIDTRSAGGRLVLNVLMSVAQWEREATGERTRAVIQLKRTRGEHTGGDAPYGYAAVTREDGVRVLVEQLAEQRVLEVMRDMRARGLSLRVVAEELNVRGYTTRSGRAWLPQYIHNVLGREDTTGRAAA